MTAEPISPLRQRMIEDMTIRQFSDKTQKDYVRVIRNFAIFIGRSPDLAEAEDLRRFQLRLATSGASPAEMGAAASALRFFFKVTLGRPGFGDRLATVPRPDRLPVVLSPEEVAIAPLRDEPRAQGRPLLNLMTQPSISSLLTAMTHWPVVHCRLPSTWASVRLRRRQALGVSPTTRRNCFERCAWSAKPLASAI